MNSEQGRPSGGENASSPRLMRAVRANLEGVIGNTKNIFNGRDVEGKSNIMPEILKGQKVIFAVTHLSDVDLQLATAAVGDSFDVQLTNDKSHYSLRNPLPFISMLIAGRRHFSPIDHEKPYTNPAYADMARLLDRHKALIIAAHNSIEIPQTEADWHLPDKSGRAAVYMAELTGAVIVPVAINMDKLTGFGGESQGVADILLTRIKDPTTARVIIGQPIDPVGILGENFSGVLNKSQRDDLREQSTKVMQSLAALLPESKRGIWDNEALSLQ